MSEGCDCSMTQLSGISQNLACQDLGFLRLQAEMHHTPHSGWRKDQCVVQNTEGTLLHTNASSARQPEANILLV